MAACDYVNVPMHAAGISAQLKGNRQQFEGINNVGSSSILDVG
jgi:hypothetical protein